jgi:hypothetical protein
VEDDLHIDFDKAFAIPLRRLRGQRRIGFLINVLTSAKKYEGNLRRREPLMFAEPSTSWASS